MSESHKMPMPIGVFAKTFSGITPSEVFAAARAAGFEAVQYNMACSGLPSLPSVIGEAIAMDVTRAARATNIRIAAVSATYNMTDPDPQRRRAGRNSFAAIASRAKTMNTRIITVCSGSLDPDNQWRRHKDNSTPEAWTDMCREFEILIPIATANDLIIGVEPEHANVVSSAPKASKLLATFKGGPLRVIVDPANLLEECPKESRKQVLTEAFDLLGPNIALAHVKDRDEAGNVVPAGRGIVDWPQYLGGLKQTGYTGALVAHGMSAEAAPDVATFLRESLAAL